MVVVVVVVSRGFSNFQSCKGGQLHWQRLWIKEGQAPTTSLSPSVTHPCPTALSKSSTAATWLSFGDSSRSRSVTAGSGPGGENVSVCVQERTSKSKVTGWGRETGIPTDS